MKTKDFPLISTELIEALDAECPGKVPLREITPFEQGKIVGQIELIEKLRRIHQQQLRKAMSCP